MTLHGFPVGGASQKHRDVTASFFLTDNPLSKRVSVTIAGRRTTVRKVGKNASEFYVARLPAATQLAWDRRYRIRICVKGSPCQTKIRELPPQRL